LLLDCGFTDYATNVSKVLSSPNWPDDYNNFDNCEWWIFTLDGSRIEISFSSIDLEEYADFLVGFFK